MAREALFAFAQTVVDGSRPGATVLCPNPFYQIYEGGAAGWRERGLRQLGPGAQLRGRLGQRAGRGLGAHAVDLRLLARQPNRRGDAAGGVARLFELSDRHGFVIASDECYPRSTSRDEAPLGGLEAAAWLGRHDFRRLVSFTSLSKRSNVPGLRAGFVAGDASLIRQFLLYRTYHGSAMSPLVQAASIAAWNDEAHVIENRQRYRAKFAAVTPMLAEVLDVALPDAGFYLWAGVPGGGRRGIRPATPRSIQCPGPAREPARPGVRRPEPRRRARPAGPRGDEAECLEAAQRIVSPFTRTFSAP